MVQVCLLLASEATAIRAAPEFVATPLDKDLVLLYRYNVDWFYL
jgi:hypothetical protein